MKILLIEDREERQKQFSQIDLNTNNMIDNKINDDYNIIKQEFQDDTFDLDTYNVIITHRSAFGLEGKQILDNLRDYCKNNDKQLVFFSGGISNTFYTKQPFEALSLNSKVLYSDNLRLFIEDAQNNNEFNLLILAYGKDWKLNPLLNTLENINKFIIEMSDKIDYDELNDEIELDLIESIIELEQFKTKNDIQIDDVQDIKKDILEKINLLLGGIYE